MTARPRGSRQKAIDSPELVARAADLMLDKKAKDVTILDVRNLTNITDFVVICTGETDIQVKAVADHLHKVLSKEGERPYHIEGYEQLSWVLLDYVDVVAHVFLPETRSHYDFERLWADAKVSEVTENSRD